MKRAFNDTYQTVEIDWTKPFDYEDIFNLGVGDLEYAWFYKILARFSNKDYKLLYIGKTHRLVNQRLKDMDHKKRIQKIKVEYPRHQIKVSLGNLYNLEKLPSDTLIDHIETLLIYTHTDLGYLENIKKVRAHQIKEEYLIINNGFKQGGMVREIHLGVFYKK